MDGPVASLPSMPQSPPPSSVVVEDYFPSPSADMDGHAAVSPPNGGGDPLFDRLRSEALAVLESEPAMGCLLERTVLHPSVNTFEQAVARSVAHRLSAWCGSNPDVCPQMVLESFVSDLSDAEDSEMGHTAGDSVREDALAYVSRDPACETLLEPILFFKGYASVVCHRVARKRWRRGNRFVALWLQSQASGSFGVDIHPLASIGKGVMIDHATGVVIGETATVGDGTTLLHGVTLGGTGKHAGDRHPKVGRDVLIGAGTSVLGNITVGDGAKIGAGSIVLRPIPHGATAVGAPAKIVGWAKESTPGSNLDQLLKNVERAGRSVVAGDTTVTTTQSAASLMTLDSTKSSLEDLTAQTDKGGEEDGESEDFSSEEIAGDTKSSPSDTGNSEEEDKVAAKEGRSVVLNDGALRIPKPSSHRRPRSVTYPLIEDEEVDFCSSFRNFATIKDVPSDAVSYCSLSSLLLSEGCDDAEVGEVFFELLRTSKHHEYVQGEVFRERFQDVAGRFTRIKPGRLKELANLTVGDKKGKCLGGDRRKTFMSMAGGRTSIAE